MSGVATFFYFRDDILPYINASFFAKIYYNKCVHDFACSRNRDAIMRLKLL